MSSRFHLFIYTLTVQFCLPHSVADGSYKKDYPPWNEPNVPTAGAPKWVLPILVPLTRHGCGPSRYMSMRIAVSHMNRRDASVCPAIAELQNLFEIEYEVADSNANSVGALEGAITLQERLKARGITMAVLEGPNSSGSSKATSSYLAIFGVPQISWAATNAQLSNKASYPNFFRVVSPDSHVMAVLAKFVKYLGYGTVNAVYFDAEFQAGQLNDFRAGGTEEGLTLLPFALPNSGQGGAPVSPENLVVVKDTLMEIKKGMCRVVIGMAIASEANDLWKAAYDMNLIADEGWFWLGADGISGSNIQGEVSRTEWFSGTLYVIVSSVTPAFEDYKARWAADMSTTDIPEFFNQTNCRGGSVCANHPEFKGWNVGQHDNELQCTGYTGLAYDATVTLAVVLDRMITADKASNGTKEPNDFTAAEWTAELKELQKPEKALTCLTGEITINDKHDRMMGITVFNWQKGLLTAPIVASWSGVSGFTWVEGQELVWPSGDSVNITDASALPPKLPSGRPPICATGSIYDFLQGLCIDCAAGKYFAAGVCVDCTAGKFSGATGLSKCTDCAAGKFNSASGLLECTDCAAGTITSLAGLSACSACPEGTFNNADGLFKCTDCAAGKFNDAPGQLKCTDCAAGTITSMAGLSACSDCPAGKFNIAAGLLQCTDCAPGKFNNAAGLLQCTDCEAGKFNNAAGLLTCTDCPAGTFNIAAGLLECTDCAAGKFNNAPGLLQCIDCKAGKFNNAAGLLNCTDCSAGTFNNAAGLLECTDCAAGKFNNAPGLLECTDCAAGTMASTAGLSTCSDCPEGKFNNATGLLTCTDCAVGTVTSAAGLSGCSDCRAGTFQAKPGKDECEDCPVGQHNTKSRSTKCDPCAIGKYQDESGFSECKACVGPHFTTEYPGAWENDMCQCQAGYYRDESTRACVACLESMTCNFGSDMMLFGQWESAGRPATLEAYTFPILKPFYTSKPDEPLAIYKCKTEKKCPGGPPGTCGPGLRTDLLSCAHCEDDSYWTGDGCETCTDIETSAFLYPTLPLIVGPFLVSVFYYLFRDDFQKWNSWQNSGAAFAFLLLNHYQIANLVTNTDIKYHKTVSGLLEFWAFANDVTSVLSPQCAGFAHFSSKVVALSLGPLFMALIFLLTFGISKIVQSLTQMQVGMLVDRTVNIYFSVILAFFAGICAMSFILFKCHENPSGNPTLNQDESIICYEGEWTDVVVVAAASILIYVIGCGALFVWVICVATRKFVDIRFQRRWKFLFIKYRPNVYWWSLPFLAKGVLMNLGFTFLPLGIQQLYWIMGVAGAYALVSIIFAPWRIRLANTLEVFIHIDLMFVVSLLTWYARGAIDSAEDLENVNSDISAVVVALNLSPVLFFACLYIYTVTYKISSKERDQLQQVAQKMQKTWNLFVKWSEKDMSNFLFELSEWDRYYLAQATVILEAELYNAHDSNRVFARTSAASEHSESFGSFGAPAGSGAVASEEKLIEVKKPEEKPTNSAEDYQSAEVIPTTQFDPPVEASREVKATPPMPVPPFELGSLPPFNP